MKLVENIVFFVVLCIRNGILSFLVINVKREIRLFKGFILCIR